MTAQDSSIEKVGVVGLGYVGLPLTLALIDAGYSVTGVDIDQDRVDQLRAGRSYVRDVSDSEVIAANEANLQLTVEYDELSDADAVSVCVPTPLSKTGQPNVSYVDRAANNLADVLSEESIIILESTVYPGATEEIVSEQFAQKGWDIGEDVFVAFSPERIDPGSEEYGVTDIPKVIGGMTGRCADRTVAYYDTVFDKTVRVSSTRTAEFTKLMENTFRSVNIGFINELAITAQRLEVDIWEAIEAAKTKPFGYMPFYPGPGLGGHCIPIDPQHLSWKAKQQGLETRYVDLADRINRGMPEHVVNRVATLLNTDGVALLNADVLLLGVAYKPDVSDTRQSPAYDIIDQLRDRGANVQYHDPHVSEFGTEDWSYQSREFNRSLLLSQDCVIIVTDHSEVDYLSVAEAAPRVFDTRNAISQFTDIEGIERL